MSLPLNVRNGGSSDFEDRGLLDVPASSTHDGDRHLQYENSPSLSSILVTSSDRRRSSAVRLTLISWDEQLSTWDAQYGQRQLEDLNNPVIDNHQGNAAAIIDDDDRNYHQIQQQQQQPPPPTAATVVVIPPHHHPPFIVTLGSAADADPEVVRKRVVIGISLLATSVLLNVLVVILFAFSLTTSQFYYTRNDTRINVYMSGEGPGNVFQGNSPLPDCAGGSFGSAFSTAVGANVFGLIGLMLTPFSCALSNKVWRFIRPVMFLWTAFLGSSCYYMVVLNFKIGCGGSLSWYRAGPGSFLLLFGSIFALLLALGSFAQISRYPVTKYPSKIFLLSMIFGGGRYLEEEEENDGHARGGGHTRPHRIRGDLHLHYVRNVVGGDQERGEELQQRMLEDVG